MELTKREQAWLARLEKCINAAPKSLNYKLCSYTIGDNDITIYDKAAQDAHEAGRSHYEIRDRGTEVDDAGTEVMRLYFPFTIESTAG